MPSYEQRGKNKLWSVCFREFDLDTNEEKRMRLSGFKTKREAQAAYHDHLNEYEAEKARRRAMQEDTEDMPFKQLAELYFRYMATRAKESTVYDARGKFEARIIPFFEKYTVKQITPAIILEFIQSLNGYSYAYTKKMFYYVSAVLGYGEKYHDLPNVSRKVDKPRNLEPKKEMLFWTPDEFSQFYAAIKEQRFKAFFHLLYESGCRRGEAEALNWTDVDFTRNRININKNVTRKTEQVAYAITTPKNASSNRFVTLTEELCQELKEWHREQKKEGVATYVFGGEHPPTMKSVDRAFASAIEASGVKKIRIHDLRHSCASLLISKGVSIVAVSKRLGHSTVEQTLNTYSHMMPDDDRMSLDAFKNIAQNLGSNLGTKK